MEREKLSVESFENALDEINSHTRRVIQKKGFGILKSSHEILGIITEEYAELIDAIRSNNREDIKSEILDIATACQLALASMESGHLDWL
ncbi:hypothetical protein JWG44_05620 [Leptospira sp. 201903071]|uniref:MazG nucleotide pyrophosphohydrolase domain-containing protein n=1 Tax=Leptospira ainazelensis TaxID=2810034 RepID=UPI00196559B2|nr:MazG nucleotide pyrophosphohydrolase domain-containing protein [Leptospira ainazelensis]MBM9499728.1 hypothetical protein [Leptospira ainazelensis]